MTRLNTRQLAIAAPSIVAPHGKSVEFGSDTLSFLSPSELTAYVRKDCKTIRCGGVCVENLRATSVARKKLQQEPTLETVRFCPFASTAVSASSFSSTNLLSVCPLFRFHVILINRLRRSYLSADEPRLDRDHRHLRPNYFT